MKKQDNKKKLWKKPEIKALSIKKETLGGSGSGAEGADKWGPPGPPVS